MVNDYNEDEIKGMQKLIRESIKEYLSIMGYKNVNHTSDRLVKDNRSRIIQLLNKPMGGTLAPEEIAEMLIIQDLRKRNNTEEAAATTAPLIYG